MYESLKGRKSEEMTQSNIFFPRDQNYLLHLRGVMAVEVPQNEEISGGGKNR